MFFDQDLKGNHLPAKTLCLTYDDGPGETAGDGPGPQTRELARYLFEEGIRATFFVVGRHAEGRADLLRCLKEWGHLVGNHTYSHPGLVAVAAAGGDVVGEVARTAQVIREHVAGNTIFLRPPYGNWREEIRPGHPDDSPRSVVADVLNGSPEARSHVGPVNWDVSGHDYDYWRRGASAAEAAAEYLDRIECLGRGLVLMHDSSEEEPVRRGNRTRQLTRLLVPTLKARGYRFVGLDAVPQVCSALRVVDQVYLEGEDGRLLARRDGGADLVFRAAAEGGDVFGVVPVGADRWALRAGNGLYLSALRGGDGAVLARAPGAGDWESLAPEQAGGSAVVFRTVGGSYLNRDEGPDGPLAARATSARRAERFVLRRRFAGWAPAQDPGFSDFRRIRQDFACIADPAVIKVD